MEVGVFLQGSIGQKRMVDLPAFARQMEDWGYSSVWMSEGRAGNQFAVLTACALATSTIELGTNITSVYTRTPPTVGLAALTVDAFSEGRFVLGLGTDHRTQVVTMHSLRHERPLQTIREATAMIRQLFEQHVISFHGEVFDSETFDVTASVDPPRKDLPIYVSAVNPKMLELAGEIADGVIPLGHTLDYIPSAKGLVWKGAEKAGKRPEDVAFCSMLQACVDDDGDEARARMRRQITGGARRSAAGVSGHRLPRYDKLRETMGFGEEWAAVMDARNAGDQDKAAALVSDRYLDQFTITGAPEEARAKLQEFREAGVDHPILSAGGTDEQILKTLHALSPAAA